MDNKEDLFLVQNLAKTLQVPPGLQAEHVPCWNPIESDYPGYQICSIKSSKFLEIIIPTSESVPIRLAQPMSADHGPKLTLPYE